MSRIWVQLDSPSEGVWIRRWPRDKLREHLYKIMNAKKADKINLWADIICDWEGFVDGNHHPIPYTKENLAFCFNAGEKYFRRLVGEAFRIVHKSYGTDSLAFDNTLTVNWEAIGIPGLQKGISPLGQNDDSDSIFVPKDGAGAREAIKFELAAYYNDKIKHRIDEHIKAWGDGSGVLAAVKMAAHTDGKPNHEYALTHKEDLQAMLRCCRSEIENMATTGIMCAPFYFKRVFVLARKAKMYDLEKWACDTIIKLCDIHDKAHKVAGSSSCIARGMPAYRQAKERLPKIRELMKKTKEKEKAAARTRPTKAVTPKPKKSESKDLESQCEKYSIPLEKTSLEWDRGYKRYLKSQERLVELAVRHYLMEEGKYDIIVPHEGHSLLIMMQAACLSMLREASKKLTFEDYHARTFTVQLQMYPLNRKEVERCILAASDITVENGIYEITQNKSVQKWFPGLRHIKRDIFRLYKAIDKELYANIVKKIISQPDIYGAGWFDLICIKDGNLSFIEVKTTDTLRDSQIAFINDIAKPFCLDLRVIQVQKNV